MIFNCETFRKYFISLPAYSLIMWLMRSPKNWEEETPVSRGRNREAVTHTQDPDPPQEQGDQPNDEKETQTLEVIRLGQSQSDRRQTGGDTLNRKPIRVQISQGTERTPGHTSMWARTGTTTPAAHKNPMTGITKVRGNLPMMLSTRDRELFKHETKPQDIGQPKAWKTQDPYYREMNVNEHRKRRYCYDAEQEHGVGWNDDHRREGTP